MSGELQIDTRGEYISSVICQRIHELVLAVREGKIPDAGDELISLTEHYGRLSSIKVLIELLNSVLSLPDKKVEKNSKENHFLNVFISDLLKQVDCHYIIDNAFMKIHLKSHCLSYSTFLSAMGMDELTKCIFSIILLSIQSHPFGKDVISVLKSSLKPSKFDKDSILYKIYKTDIISFIQSHKDIWNEEESQALFSKFNTTPTSMVFFSPLISSHVITKSLYTPISVTNTLSLLPEVGCVLCCSDQVLQSFIHHIYNSQSVRFSPQEVASVLISMANSEVVDDIASQLPLSKDILASFDIKLPKELLVHCWDPAMVVRALKHFDSALDFQQVFDALDCEGFTVSNAAALQFLVNVWKAAGLQGSITMLLHKQWTYKKGEFSLIKQLLEAPAEVFTHAKQSALRTNFPSFTIPPAFLQWTYDDVLEGLLTLLETNFFDEAKSLFAPIIHQEPTLILLLLLYLPSFSYMKRYFLEQLLLRVLSSAISLNVMEVLQKAIVPVKSMVVGMLELFLRTHETVPNAMLMNINQLGLQELLLVSKNHTVFNQLFVKNWSTDSNDAKPLEDTLHQRIDRFGATVLNNMISFITSHAQDFEKASQPLFSLLRLIEQCEFSYKFIDNNVVTPIKEVITSLTHSSPSLKTAWETIIQAEAEKMIAALQQESKDWDVYCDDIKALRHSPYTYDSYIYHAFLKQLYSSIQSTIEHNDHDLMLILIKALGILIERRILEEEERGTLKEVIAIIEKAASSPLSGEVYQRFMQYIAVCLRDHTDLESQVKNNPNFQLLHRSSSAQQSMPHSPYMMMNQGYNQPMTESSTVNQTSTPPSFSRALSSEVSSRSTFNEAVSSELINPGFLDESKKQFITRLMNQLGANNVGMITTKLFSEITPEFYPAFCTWFVDGYIARQDKFTQVYLDMIISRKDSHLENLFIDASILAVIRILKEKDNLHKQIALLARFIGGLTISRDHVLLTRKINVKKMLDTCVKESRMIPTLIFSCELLSCCKNSTVLKCPSQPWLHSLLISLWSIHTNPRITESRSQYVPNLFDVFINMGYQEQIDSIKKEVDSQFNTSMPLSPTLSYSNMSASTPPLVHSRSLSGLSSVSQSHVLQHSMSMHGPQYHPNTNVNPLPSPLVNAESELETRLTSGPNQLIKDNSECSKALLNACLRTWQAVKNTIVNLPNISPFSSFIMGTTNQPMATLQEYCRNYAYQLVSDTHVPLSEVSERYNVDTKAFIKFMMLFSHEMIYRLVFYFMQAKDRSNPNMKLHNLYNSMIYTYINANKGINPNPKNEEEYISEFCKYFSYPVNQGDPTSDFRFGFLVESIHKSLYDVKPVNVFQLVLPLLFKVNNRTTKFSLDLLFESAIQNLLMNKLPISMSFLRKCIKQRYVHTEVLDACLANFMQSCVKQPELEEYIITLLNNLIQKLLIDSNCLYSNNISSTLQFIEHTIQTNPESPYSVLKQTLLKLQRKYELLVHEGVYVKSFTSVLRAWVDLCAQSQGVPSEEDTITFIMALKKKGLFSSEVQTTVAMRLLFIAALELNEKGKELSIPRSLSRLIISLIRYTDFPSKSSVLLCAMTSMASVLADDFMNNNTRGNQPALQILMDLLQYLLEPLLPRFVNPATTPVAKSDVAVAIDLLRVYLYGLTLMQPDRLPGFVYAWITLFCHSSLCQLVKMSGDTILEGQYKTLILCMNRFTTQFAMLDAYPKSVELFIKVLTSFYLELVTVWPAFVSKHYGDFCVTIPIRYLQIHNIITSAEPPGLTQFNPVAEVISPELMKCFNVPTADFWDTAPYLSHPEYEKSLRGYEKYQLFEKSQEGAHYLTDLVNLCIAKPMSPPFFALLYEVPYRTYMKFEKNQDKKYPVEFFTKVIMTILGKDGGSNVVLREVFMSIMNHIRYPSTDTFSFCMLLKTLLKADKLDIIISFIVERLATPGPKSWGLQFLFNQLVNSDKDIVKGYKVYQTNPTVRSYVDQYSKKK